MAIRISVKGTVGQAQTALVTRGLRAVLVSQGGRDEDQRSFWDVAEDRREAVVRWFCEPAVCDEAVGFPAGTLLHHG